MLAKKMQQKSEVKNWNHMKFRLLLCGTLLRLTFNNYNT